MTTTAQLYDRLNISIERNEEMTLAQKDFLSLGPDEYVTMPDGSKTPSNAMLVKMLGGQVTSVNGERGDVEISADSLGLGSAAFRPAQDFMPNSKEIIKTVESIEDLMALTGMVDGDVVYVKGYHKPTNMALENPYKGGDCFTYSVSSSDENDGGTIVNGWARNSKPLYSIEDFGGICDYVINVGGYDNAIAISRSLDALGYALVTGNTGTSKPIYLKTGQSLLQTGNDLFIAKTTNELGIGSNTAPQRSGISDSYAIDAGVIVTHKDNAYCTSVKIDVDLLHASPKVGSIGIYAPRFYWADFDCSVFRYHTSVKTHDGFNSKVKVKAVACSTGLKWANDGSNYVTGTSIDFTGSWVAFDTTYNVPEVGFDIYQLWYSVGNNLAVDNGKPLDSNLDVVCYKFQSCRSLRFSGGAEGNRGSLLHAVDSQIDITGMKTAAFSGGGLSFINAKNSQVKFGVTQFDQILNETQPTIITDASTLSMRNQPTGSTVRYQNGGVVRIYGDASDYTLLNSTTRQIYSGMVLCRKPSTNNYTAACQVVNQNDLILDIDVFAKTSDSVSTSKFKCLFKVGATPVVIESNQSGLAGIITGLDIETDGNVFVKTSVESELRLTIQCFDTAQQGVSSNYIYYYE